MSRGNWSHGDAAGGRRTPEYVAWYSMLARCGNPKHASFKNYGGRGITVCDEWRASYEAFLRDMGRKPSPTHSIERDDSDGPYCKANCRWATATEQGANRRNTVRVVIDGESMTAKTAAAKTGIPHRTVLRWASAGGDVSALVHARLKA